MSVKIGILGAGSYGLALGKLWADHGHHVRVWARSGKRDPMRLSGIAMPKDLLLTTDMHLALSDAHLVVSAVPMVALRSVWQSAILHIKPNAPIVSTTKGIEIGSYLLSGQVLAEIAGEKTPIAHLSGPSFAQEVAQGLPTAVSLAAVDEKLASQLQSTLSTATFRAYTTTDVIGVEIGGALKNIVAIAAGAAETLNLGRNAQAALMTRGLAEMSRLAVAMGAAPMTLMGLSGMGDLVLTCTGELSRNRFVGMQVAKGKPLDLVLADLGQAVEGVQTAKSIPHFCQRYQIEMPICEGVYKLLFEGADPATVVDALMKRPLRQEID